jgi:hypothetical protein
MNQWVRENRFLRLALCVTFAALVCRVPVLASSASSCTCGRATGLTQIETRLSHLNSERTKSFSFAKRCDVRSDSPDPFAAALRTVSVLSYYPSASGVQRIHEEAKLLTPGLHLWPFPRPPSILAA